MIITNLRDALLEPRPLNNLGRIPNPEEFSRPVSENAYMRDIIIGNPVNPELSSVPQQFHQVVEMACAAHLAKLKGNIVTHGEILISQAQLGRGENLRLTQRHIDATVENYPETTYLPTDTYIVSDALPTQFYTKPLLLPEELPIPHTTDPEGVIQHYGAVLRHQFDMAIDERHFVTPDPYDLINYGALMVHQAQIAVEPTFRTMCLLNFR